MISEERLTEIERLTEATTEGPWARLIYRGSWAIAPRGKSMLDCIAMADRHENAAFIAESRTIVPELVAEVRRLRKQLEAAEVVIASIRFAKAFGDGSGQRMLDAFWKDYYDTYKSPSEEDERKSEIAMPPLGKRVLVTRKSGHQCIARRDRKADGLFRPVNSIQWLNDDDKFIDVPNDPVISWKLMEEPTNADSP